MVRLLLSVLALGFPAAALAAQAAPITVFVVRHAEKGPENPDPSLTPAGQQRAMELARVLGDTRITAAYASEFKRTRETVAPLASAAGIAVTVVPAAKPDSLVGLIRALPPGSRVVVASHSNLVHVIVERLTGVAVPPLTEADYDRLAVAVVGGPAGKGAVFVIRYGEK
jgi:broad specificity phosphatase PhoE